MGFLYEAPEMFELQGLLEPGDGTSGYVTRAVFNGCSPDLRDFLSVRFSFSSHSSREMINDGEVAPFYTFTQDPGIQLVLHHLRPITEVSAFFTGIRDCCPRPDRTLAI
jgi:hypothetical protein